MNYNKNLVNYGEQNIKIYKKIICERFCIAKQSLGIFPSYTI